MPELPAGAIVPQHVWCPYLRAARFLHVDTIDRGGHGLAVYALQRLPDSKIVDAGMLLALAMHGQPLRQASVEAARSESRPSPLARQSLVRAVASALRSLKLLFT